MVGEKRGNGQKADCAVQEADTGQEDVQQHMGLLVMPLGEYGQVEELHRHA